MRYAALLFVTLLAACASQGLENKRQALLRQGQPPAYVDGHIDGCNSGTTAAGNPYYRFAKDVNRFETDKLYAQGWNDGFIICKSQYESTLKFLR